MSSIGINKNCDSFAINFQKISCGYLYYYLISLKLLHLRLRTDSKHWFYSNKYSSKSPRPNILATSWFCWIITSNCRIFRDNYLITIFHSNLDFYFYYSITHNDFVFSIIFFYILNSADFDVLIRNAFLHIKSKIF